MTAATQWVRRAMLTAFLIWFAHFMACWIAVEAWPNEWQANRLAWVFTALALLAMGVHAVRLRRTAPAGDVAAFARRFASGAVALATLAVAFTALPTVFFLP